MIIKDVSGDANISEEDLEHELERAFEEEAEMIIIEPKWLGDEVSRWITVGNFLHKASVISGLMCLGFQHFHKSRTLVLTFGTFSSVCAIFYAVSWKNDPCCKFQVAENVPELEHMVTSVTCPKPVVLVHKNDHRRKVLHNTIALVSGIVCAVKALKWLTFD